MTKQPAAGLCAAAGKTAAAGIRGQISRAFGRKRRIGAVVASLTQIYFLIDGIHELQMVGAGQC
jgi:hypothetical protein